MWDVSVAYDDGVVVMEYANIWHVTHICKHPS